MNNTFVTPALLMPKNSNLHCHCSVLKITNSEEGFTIPFSLFKFSTSWKQLSVSDPTLSLYSLVTRLYCHWNLYIPPPLSPSSLGILELELVCAFIVLHMVPSPYCVQSQLRSSSCLQSHICTDTVHITSPQAIFHLAVGVQLPHPNICTMHRYKAS